MDCLLTFTGDGISDGSDDSVSIGDVGISDVIPLVSSVLCTIPAILRLTI